LEFVFAMFAEDSELIPKGMFAQTLDAARKLGRLDPVYNLFDDFGRERAEDRSNPFAPFVDGSLYDREHPKIALSQEQIDALYAAARDFDWQDVRPEIFGSIFEQALDPADRHELGAHFTREEDILKVVLPTVLEPWRERIGATRKPKDVIAAAEAMKAFHVLDPACGCGNFLYVVYREMKRLEASLRDRWKIVHSGLVKSRRDVPPPPPGPYFTLYQVHGIEINSFAAQLSRVVLWIGEHLAQRELSLGEETLPLKDLENVIENRDALLSPWPRGEGELAIVGNPPYMGVRKMRMKLSDGYVEELFERYPENRTADYVTYWFPQALATLRPGERCGFVTTNSIAQNESREASIDKVLAAGGTLTDVWKSYPWPGEAAVHVSIVNWTMGAYDGIKKLDGEMVSRINSRLADEIQATDAKPIRANQGLSFMGVTPGNKEFILDEEQRKTILEKDPKSEAVIKPFLIGRDLNREIEQKPTRWIIDFGMMDRKEAERYLGAFRYVQRNVYPIRKLNRRESYVKYWWRFVEPRSGMREALDSLMKYIAISSVTPHVIFCVSRSSILPDHSLIVVALDKFYTFGILQSRYHEVWAWASCSTFETRLRYTPTTVFETFPFPDPPNSYYDPRQVPRSPEARRLVDCAKELYKCRAALCKEKNLGLTKIYNLMKQGDLPELEELHNRLNDAVTACYGWPEGTWRDDNEVLSRLLALNLQLTGDGGD
jgi:hypothetical protein